MLTYKTFLATANLYIEGVRTGNIKMLRKTFHPQAMMYGASAANVTILKIEGLYTYVAANDAPAKTSEPHQCFIKTFSYAGNAACIEMVEDSSFGFDYTNYFQLLKIEGSWIIVSRAYDATLSKS